MPATFQINASEPTFLAQWVSGTYLVSGVFPIESNSLTTQQVVLKIPSLYLAAKSSKLAKWPRGICGYYLIPVYIADFFDESVVAWVHSYHFFRWAIWHEPVLYCKADNTAHSRNDYGLRGKAFRVYLSNVMGGALKTVASRFNFEFPEKINGRKVDLAIT
ncbi:MAG: hypothetical protein ABR955_01305 [Verrucomicrobiota bacterium]|jgi:hypothetical protein